MERQTSVKGDVQVGVPEGHRMTLGDIVLEEERRMIAMGDVPEEAQAGRRMRLAVAGKANDQEEVRRRVAVAGMEAAIEEDIVGRSLGTGPVEEDSRRRSSSLKSLIGRSVDCPRANACKSAKVLPWRSGAPSFMLSFAPAPRQRLAGRIG